MNYQHIDALLRRSDSAKSADFNGRILVTQGHFACEYASFTGETQPYPKLRGKLGEVGTMRRAAVRGWRVLPMRQLVLSRCRSSLR